MESDRNETNSGTWSYKIQIQGKRKISWLRFWKASYCLKLILSLNKRRQYGISSSWKSANENHKPRRKKSSSQKVMMFGHHKASLNAISKQSTWLIILPSCTYCNKISVVGALAKLQKELIDELQFCKKLQISRIFFHCESRKLKKMKRSKR